MLRWKRSVSVSFAREILSRRKNVIYILYREIAKKTSHVPRLHNFQGALSTTDGRRSEASGIVEPDTRLWGVDGCLLVRVPHRENLISNVSPERVLRVSTLSGAHYQRVLRIRELDRRIRQDGNFSRDLTSFLSQKVRFFYARMTPIYLNDRTMSVLT